MTRIMYITQKQINGFHNTPLVGRQCTCGRHSLGDFVAVRRWFWRFGAVVVPEADGT